MATPTTTLSDLSSKQSQLFFTNPPCASLKPWSTRVNVRSTSRQRPIITTVSFSLPTAKRPDRGSSSSSSSSSASPEKIPNFVERLKTCSDQVVWILLIGVRA